MGTPLCATSLSLSLSLDTSYALLSPYKKKDEKKDPPSLSESEPTTKKKKHHFSISPFYLQADSLVFASLPDRVLSISVDPVPNYPIISVFQY